MALECWSWGKEKAEGTDSYQNHQLVLPGEGRGLNKNLLTATVNPTKKKVHSKMMSEFDMFRWTLYTQGFVSSIWFLDDAVSFAAVA